jgi:hypothetical protein
VTGWGWRLWRFDTFKPVPARKFDWVPLTCPTHLAASRSSRIELHLYTGTLIKDLYASVERAEQGVASRSDKALYQPTAARIKTEPACRLNCHQESRTSEPEKFPQPLGLSAADWNLALLLIVHAQLVRTLEPGHDFSNPIDIHQIGAVSPPEQPRIQAGQ